MKRLIALSLLLLTCLLSLNCFAQSADPLWDKVMALNKACLNSS